MDLRVREAQRQFEGKEKRTGLTLCVKYNGNYYPLNTAHDGRPILMNKENVIKS